MSSREAAARVRSKAGAVRRHWRRMLTHPGPALRFLLVDPETTNYTYPLANLPEMGRFLAGALAVSEEVVAGFIEELEHDDELRALLAARLSSRRDRKRHALYGRRTGWYCLVRALRPRLVVETGVHDGLGSSVLLRALQRNREQGDPGRLVGIDVDPLAGWLVPTALPRDLFDLVIEPSLGALPRLLASGDLDLFIHDSDHRREYELEEFRIALPSLSARGVLVSDNAHVTDALATVSRESGRRYGFWAEVPRDHFYPGAGIGISLPPEPRADT